MLKKISKTPKIRRIPRLSKDEVTIETRKCGVVKKIGKLLFSRTSREEKSDYSME